MFRIRNDLILHTVERMKIGAMFTVRQAASSPRTIKAVWNSYDAFADLLMSVILSHIYCHLTSEYFVANLALMYDGLEKLA